MDIKKISLVVSICFVFFIQCTTNDSKVIEEKETSEKYSDEIILLRNFIAKSLKTTTKKVVYDSNQNAFIIDEDVFMPLEEARNRYNDAGLNSTSKSSQMFSGWQMSPEMASSVQVYIYPEVTPEWRIAIDKAIINWNNANSGIHITTINTATTLSVKIRMGDIVSTSAIANAYFPYAGNPGPWITINTANKASKLSDAERISAMTHELGHTFGLAHTDGTSGSLIPCTPVTEMASIMFSMVSDWSGFTAYDNIAISTLYPVAIGTKMLYRYKKNQYYFYTTNPCEIPPGKDGYDFDGDAGYLYSTQIPGTVPLYRILNGTTIKDHRLNKVKTSNDDIILGYIFTTQQPGTTALYSYGIYESRMGQIPLYMYHYNYSTTDSEVVLKSIVGYVSSKVITKDGQKVHIWL